MALLKVLTVTEKAIVRLSGRWFILKSKQIPLCIYDGVYFKCSCRGQLIRNFTKNEHHRRYLSRVLPLFHEYPKSIKTTITNFQYIFERLLLVLSIFYLLRRKLSGSQNKLLVKSFFQRNVLTL